MDEDDEETVALVEDLLPTRNYVLSRRRRPSPATSSLDLLNWT